MKANYIAILLAGEDGRFYARVPGVNGCISSGRGLTKALENIKDALCTWLCDAEDRNEQLPEPTDVGEVEDGAVIALIEVDTLRYRAETDTRAVRKNVSMPAWLAFAADKRGLNVSQILQDALKRELGYVE